MLKASLSESMRRGDWPAVRKILLVWSLCLFAFVGMLFTCACYGCLLFEDRRQTADDAFVGNTNELLIRARRLAAKSATKVKAKKKQRPPGNTDELLIAWGLSAFQRFLLHEPTLILAAKGLPILFASDFCANLCGESIVNLLSTLFSILLELLKRLKS